MGIKDLQDRLLCVAEELGYQVLLGPTWIGGGLGSHWDAFRREQYHREVSRKQIWGQCDFQERIIWLEPRITQKQRVSVLVHELGHAILHASDPKRNERRWEAEAEEVRRLVGEAIGIELPANNDEWQLLSRHQQNSAFRRGDQASRQIISSLWPK